MQRESLCFEIYDLDVDHSNNGRALETMAISLKNRKGYHLLMCKQFAECTNIQHIASINLLNGMDAK
jgi:hypothetical protein